MGLKLKELGELSVHQALTLKNLTISDQQIEFGGSFNTLIDECMSGSPESIRGFGILLDDSPIGFLVLKRPPLSPDWASEDTVTLHGLKIDARWQGHGHGKAAFAAAIPRCRLIWPDAKHLALSVDADDQAALSLYRSAGMSDSDPVFQGRIGLEHCLRVALD